MNVDSFARSGPTSAQVCRTLLHCGSIHAADGAVKTSMVPAARAARSRTMVLVEKHGNRGGRPGRGRFERGSTASRVLQVAVSLSVASAFGCTDSVQTTCSAPDCEPLASERADASNSEPPPASPGRCGDGVVDPGEECDDGSACADGRECTDERFRCDGVSSTSCASRDGDGCSASCSVEPGYRCDPV